MGPDSAVGIIPQILIFGMPESPGQKIMVAMVVVQGQADAPCIGTVAGPRAPDFRGLIYHRLTSGGCQRIPIPVVRAVDCFIRGHCCIDSSRAQHVQCCDDLRREAIPQLEGEVAIRGGKRTDEVRFKRLYCSFRRIDPMIMGFDKHVGTPFIGEVLFHHCICLIVHDVEVNFIPF